jgi:hypothetical protein
MLKCVPERLFFSQLPSGELEFGCVLRVPHGPDDPPLV